MPAHTSTTRSASEKVQKLPVAWLAFAATRANSSVTGVASFMPGSWRTPGRPSNGLFGGRDRLRRAGLGLTLKGRDDQALDLGQPIGRQLLTARVAQREAIARHALIYAQLRRHDLETLL